MLQTLHSASRVPGECRAARRTPCCASRRRQQCERAVACAAATPSRRDALLLILAAPSCVPLLTAPTASAAELQHLSREQLKAVTAAFDKAAGRGKAPGLLRIVFHDAGTYSTQYGDGGANASVQYELGRPENMGLKRPWKALTRVKEELTASAPAVSAKLSMADMIALGGAYAVEVSGGPHIPIAIGRADAARPDPEDRLPPESLTAAQLKDSFHQCGFSVREMIALSGAHTLGGKGFGDPNTFSNEYYSILLQEPWNDAKNEMAQMIGLPSDKVLPRDPECRALLQEYAADRDLFYRDFVRAYRKLSELGTQL